MTRPNLLAITVVLSTLAVGGAGAATVLGVTALNHSTEASSRAEQAAAHATEALGAVKAAQNASLVSRHITVGQRCELTDRIGRHFPQDRWFVRSYEGCEKQLAMIIAELAAPAP